MTSDPG